MPAKEKKKKEKKPKAAKGAKAAKGSKAKAKPKGTTSAPAGKETVSFFGAGTGEAVKADGTKKKYSLFDSSGMDDRFRLGGKKVDWNAQDEQAKSDGFGAGASSGGVKGEEKSKIWMALNPQQLHKMTAKEKRAMQDDDNVMVMEVRGGGGMGALAAEDMQQERDEEGNIVTEVESEESDFEDDLLADFDPDTMDELTKKRMARAKEAEAHRKQLRKKSMEVKKKEQVVLDKQLAVIAKQKAAEEKAAKATNQSVAETHAKLEQLDFGFGFEEDE